MMGLVTSSATVVLAAAYFSPFIIPAGRSSLSRRMPAATIKLTGAVASKYSLPSQHKRRAGSTTLQTRMATKQPLPRHFPRNEVFGRF
jgi:hypothetical protein